MTSKERVFKAIAHEESDRIPKGDLMIAPKLIGELLGKESKGSMEDDLAARKFLNMDIIDTGVRDTKYGTPIGYDDQGREIWGSSWGIQYLYNGVTDTFLKPAITDMDDAMNYKFPTMETFSFDRIEWWHNNSDLMVMAQVGGAFDAVYPLIGYEEYMIQCHWNPDAIKFLAEGETDLMIQLAIESVKHGADMILIGDDLAFNSGTFISPATLRELVFPYIKNEIDKIKAATGVPIFLHSDGNLNEVIPDIIACGFDGMQSLQPSANMDIKKIKKKYGNDLCLMGNLDLDYLMPFGTADEVRDAVKELIEVAAPGGGFILSTCNILTQDIPVGNALAMYRTADEFGIYKK